MFKPLYLFLLISTMSDNQDFDKGDSGAAGCTPTQAGAVKKGGYCMLGGFPCKIADYSTAKPGKHGSSKATIVGYDIFTGKRYEQISPTSCNVQVPDVFKTDYEAADVDQDDFVSLIMDDGSLRQDLKIDSKDEELYKELKKLWVDNQGKGTIMFTVVKSVGKQKIIAGRIRDN